MAQIVEGKSLLVVEDHYTTKEGIKFAAHRAQAFGVIYGASTCKEAREVLKQHQVDVLTMDLRLPDCMGTRLVEEVKKKQGAKIIVHSMLEDETVYHYLYKMGVDAVVVKSADNDELSRAFASILTGQQYFSKDVEAIIEANANKDIEMINLTPRESVILQMIAGGAIAKEIGNQLDIPLKRIAKLC